MGNKQQIRLWNNLITIIKVVKVADSDHKS